MTIHLDHTIVPATDKVASASFFADIFGLTVKPGQGHFAQVQVNESLTLDFADEPEAWGGPGFDPRTGQSHHYAFHVSEAEFEAIFGRVQAKGLPYGSGPFHHTDGQNLHPPGRAGLLLRGSIRPPAGSHDRARDRELNGHGRRSVCRKSGTKWRGLRLCIPRHSAPQATVELSWILTCISAVWQTTPTQCRC